METTSFEEFSSVGTEEEKENEMDEGSQQDSHEMVLPK